MAYFIDSRKGPPINDRLGDDAGGVLDYLTGGTQVSETLTASKSPPPSSSSVLNMIKRNPVVIAGGIAIAYLILRKK